MADGVFFCVCEIVLGQGCSSSAKLTTALPRSTVLPNFKVRKHRRARLLPGNTILFLKNYVANSYTIETPSKGSRIRLYTQKKIPDKMKRLYMSLCRCFVLQAFWHLYLVLKAIQREAQEFTVRKWNFNIRNNK